MKKLVNILFLVATLFALPSFTSAPAPSTVVVSGSSGGGAVPVLTGATIRIANAANPVVPANSILPTAGNITSGLINTDQSITLTACAIAATDRNGVASWNASLFTVVVNSTSCQLSTGASGLPGAGYAYLPITASNANGASLAQMVAVWWRSNSVASSAANVVSAAPITIVAPASNPATGWPVGQVLGRIGMDVTPGVTWPGACAITAGNGSGLFQVVATPKYHCTIETNATMPASGTATLTISATPTGGSAGATGTVTINWSTLPSTAPVVSQQACAWMAPVASSSTCTVSVSNGDPTACKIASGDPGQPAWFTIQTGTASCVIKPTATLQTLSSSLGSPVLFVQATNANGTSVGNYVVIGIGPSSSPGTGDVAHSAATSAGYTQLVVDAASMSPSNIDFTESYQPGYILYSGHEQFSAPWSCDTTLFNCRYSGNPSHWDPTQDQDGDPIAPTTHFSTGTLVFPTGSQGSYMYSCTVFGIIPNNTQFNTVGNAFANGYFYDFLFTMPPATDTSNGNGAFTHALQYDMSNWIAPPSGMVGGNMVEVDWPEWGTVVAGHNDHAFNYYTILGGYTGNFDGEGDQPGSGLHHFQVLWLPNSRGGATNGTVRFFMDGVEAVNSPVSPTVTALDSQFQCIYVGNAPLTLSSVKIWQHP